MKPLIKIKDKYIGTQKPVYIIAEMSANHNQNFDKAVNIIKAAERTGADAIKLQTYTPDTLTIDCDRDEFKIKGSLWKGKNLYNLYKEAYTPWEWHPRLKAIAEDMGLDFFSTPFDETAVDFLSNMDIPAFKVASFEIVDLPLLRKIAQTGKPIIMSTGMATLAEIDEAVYTIREAGNDNIALLKCTSAYPALPEEMDLKTIPHLGRAFGVPCGVSDHTMGIAVPVAAVALGACIVEKHLTLSRSEQGPDSAFSLEPDEFKTMVDAIRTTEKAIGHVRYGRTEKEKKSRSFRRSLFVVQDMKTGDKFTPENVRSIRPGFGLHTRYIEKILGRTASSEISKGTPLSWKIVR
ncbi:NeuB [Desulforapulum autotrophicum HRM2]|uniref:NeuB n=1 Tax=Desulforapulum autotrophicum (strain ATCC 43914 / DSM 3382 / VKM B-1955 / HRM2) TaxID=177437 RepID=C0QA14_DESAH|nr:pseudaminic acid synthase [Desulforapulum autotrophicum]ACN16732.1 NeuB [Desulforapulum autotrophicum HRM2]